VSEPLGTPNPHFKNVSKNPRFRRCKQKIKLYRRESKELLWASEADDPSMWKGAWSRDGQRKVAERLAGNLKDIIAK